MTTQFQKSDPTYMQTEHATDVHVAARVDTPEKTVCIMLGVRGKGTLRWEFENSEEVDQFVLALMDMSKDVFGTGVLN